MSKISEKDESWEWDMQRDAWEYNNSLIPDYDEDTEDEDEEDC